MADYGLEVRNQSGRVLFDSREAGRGTFQYSKGSLSPGQSLTTLVSDLVLINIDKPTTTGPHRFRLAGTRVTSGNNLIWTFDYTFQTENNHPINYVILRDASQATTFGDYGLQCNDRDGTYTGPVTFDSRMFTSTEGEIVLDPNDVYQGRFGHGQVVSSFKSINGTVMTGWNGPDGLDYYNAGMLEYTSVTSYVREFSLVWDEGTNVGNTYQEIYSRYTGFYGNPQFSKITASIITVSSMANSSAPSPGAVYSFSEVHSAGQGFETTYYPLALQPLYIGRPNPNLGLYEPTNV